MKSKHLDKLQIKEYTRNHPDWTFVDSVDVTPGLFATGIKRAEEEDWYFKIHLPGYPVMPGAVVMEAIMTTGAFIITTLPEKKDARFIFSSCENVRLYQEILPGDVLETEAELISYRRGIARFRGKGTSNGRIACKMEFSLASPEEIKSVFEERI